MGDNYLDIVTDLSKNYKYITVKTKYAVGEYENAHIVNGECVYLNDLFIKGSYQIRDTNIPFHNKNMVDRLSSMEKGLYLENIDTIEDNTIVQVQFHPSNREFSVLKEKFFDKFFKEFPQLVQKMQDGKAYLFLYFGFEADSFYIDDYNKQNYYKNYYEMFESILSEWKLPSKSMIVLSSNALGYEQEKLQYNNQLPKVKCIFDNVTEWETFSKHKGDIIWDYDFDTHIQNLKKSTNYLLRVNRTTNLYRDLMIYYLFSSNNDSKSIIEHSEFNNNIELKNALNECKKISNNLGFTELEKYFEYSSDIIDVIDSKLPLIASSYENDNTQLDTEHYGIEPIPHDIYHNSIFSWVSTSLIDKDNQVFINYSTFNPILYYHPLIIHGNRYHIKSLVNSGYKSYSDFVNEDYDSSDNILERFVLNVKEIDKLFSLSKDELIQKIINSKDTLEYNRNKLFECNSIENIITKFYNIINDYKSPI